MKRGRLVFSAVLFLTGASSPLLADLIALHHGLYSSVDIGNISGVACNPIFDIVYLAHGSDDRGARIHTIDLDGRLLDSWDFVAATGKDFPTSVSYDSTSGHLFMIASTSMDGGRWKTAIVETSTDGTAIYNEIDITGQDYGHGGDGLYVGLDDIWITSFTNDTITRLSKQGHFLEQFPVEGFPTGFPGPLDLMASFEGGFFLLDGFGRRIVQVDRTGGYVDELSIMAGSWDGFGLTLDSDLLNGRIFINDDDNLYVIVEGGLPPYDPCDAAR